jgi:hypothetical protein
MVGLGGIGDPDPEALRTLCERHELDMDPSSVPDVVERFGLRFPGEPL